MGIVTVLLAGCAQEVRNIYEEANTSEGVAGRADEGTDDAHSDEENLVEGAVSSDNDNGYGRIAEFMTTDLQGNDVDNDIFEQRELTFIYLWATWCAPCRNQLPDFQELYDNYSDRVSFVTIVLDGADNPSADDLADEYLSSFTNLLPEDRLLSEIMPRYVPTSVIVDSEGYLVMDKIVGPRGNEYSQYLDEALSIIG